MSPAPAIHRLRLAVLFGQVFGTLPLRPSLHCALTHPMRCVHRLRILCFLSCGLSVSDAVTSDTSGRRFSRRAQAYGLRSFGKSAEVSPVPASFPPNKSFKPTPHRGIGHVLYATLARVRCPATGRLNSGVRHTKKEFTWPTR